MMRKQSKNGVQTRKLGSFLALLSFTAYMPVSCMQAFAADIAAGTLPVLDKVTNGDVTQAGNRLDAAVKGGKGTVAQFDWKTFNVGKDAQVNWVFNANNQTALNRVLASGGMSYIYGKLTESSGTGCAACVNTSKVILINPSGILFGNGSSVNLNSFTASTYDIKGAKNLRDLSADELSKYADMSKAGEEAGNLFNIAGYNKTVEFVANDNMVNGNGYLVADATGTRLASIVAEGSDIYANKTVAMVGNKIDIKNSKITTAYDSTPNASNATQTRSNVKLVTGDGVNFYYTSAGNIDSNVSYNEATKKTNEKQGISISDNSQVLTGDFLAYNGVEKNGSIDISKSTIRAKKLLGTDTDKYTKEQTGTSGNVKIASKGTINIADSDVQSLNDGTNSKDAGNGNMIISGKNGVNIKNAQLRTADSSKNTDSNAINAGNIIISSSAGNVNLVQDAPTDSPYYTNTGVVASGDLTISAAGDVTVDKYNKVQAIGQGLSSNKNRTINVDGANVNFKDTLLNANVINVEADKAINVQNTNVVAPSDVNLIAKNTTIDNSLMQYKNLKLYNDDSKINNVTIKNGSTFNDKGHTELTIETNGNLTVDNTGLQKQAYGSTTKTNQKGINLKSTKGNVTVQNNANVLAEGNVNVEANNNVTVSNASVYAKGGDVKVTATKGKVTAKSTNASKSAQIVAEGGTTTIKQGGDINLNNDFENSIVGGTTKLVLQSDGNVIGKNLVNGAEDIGAYKNVPTLNNTSKNARFTLSKDAKITAGKEIDLGGDGDLKLTNLTTKSGDGTKIATPGKLDLNGLNIDGGKTTLEGGEINTPNGKINANDNKVALNSPGNIDVNVSGITNPDNGLEVNAKINTGIHNGNKYGQDELIGRNVKINAGDETLAISKIKADELDVTAGKIVKGKTDITNEWDNLGVVNKDGTLSQVIPNSDDTKGYIEVRKDGKFNLDPTDKYNNSNKNIYTGGNYGTTSTTSTDNVGDQYSKITNTDVKKDVTTNSEKIGTKTVKGEEIGRSESSRTPSGDPVVTTERTDNVYENGERGYTITTTTTQEYDVVDDVTYKTITTDTYKDTETTKTTTTTETTTYQDYKTTTNSRDKQHIATLNDSEKDAFVLVYGKNSSSSKTGTKIIDKKTDTKVDTKTIITNPNREVITTGTTKGKDTRKDVVTTKKTTFCAYEDDLTPEYEGADIASWVRIPRHAEGTSNAAPVQNDLADTTSAVVAAAARLQLDNDDDEELGE